MAAEDREGLVGFNTGAAVGVVSGGNAVSSDPRFTARKSSAWCRAARGGDTGGATSADQRLGAPHSLLGLGGAAQSSSEGIRCELLTGLAGAAHLLVIAGVSITVHSGGELQVETVLNSIVPATNRYRIAIHVAAWLESTAG